mmetsp:Transcript_46108/g.73845  ORF Transcript_46108/g.73845 Transcript_46108/m.73845 type:complete len:224 (+) Transcript_46108:1009-1680(+)
MSCSSPPEPPPLKLPPAAPGPVPVSKCIVVSCVAISSRISLAASSSLMRSPSSDTPMDARLASVMLRNATTSTLLSLNAADRCVRLYFRSAAITGSYSPRPATVRSVARCCTALAFQMIFAMPVLPPSSRSTHGADPHMSVHTAPLSGFWYATHTAYTAWLFCMQSAANLAWWMTRRCVARCQSPSAASMTACCRFLRMPFWWLTHTHAQPSTLHLFARGCFQ